MTLFEKAVQFSLQKHSGQTRKESKIPYVLHPMEVASIVATMTNDENVLAAALLHDTVEDAQVKKQEILKEFGERVAALVESETEDKRADLPPESTWRIRKEETLAVLRDTDDIAVKMLWLGDKLSNMRSYYRQYKEKGDALWQAYHQKSPVEQKWYYTTIAEYLSDLKDHPAYWEYVTLLYEIFGKDDATDELQE